MFDKSNKYEILAYKQLTIKQLHLNYKVHRCSGNSYINVHTVACILVFHLMDKLQLIHSGRHSEKNWGQIFN